MNKLINLVIISLIAKIPNGSCFEDILILLSDRKSLLIHSFMVLLSECPREMLTQVKLFTFVSH